MTPQVVAASAAWVYVPDDAGEVRTAEFHVIAYPLRWSTPTIATSIASARPAAEVVDEQTLRDAETVGTEVFGGSFPDDESIAGSLRRQSEDSPRWAYRADRPVAAGGMTLVDGVARLWGGSVVEECRGTGLYRALLDVRLRTARDRGARFALVKSRVETSGPVLRRAGFERYGAERAYLVAR